MALIRYQPSSLLQQFNNEINHMFMRDMNGTTSAADSRRMPAVDIRETDDDYRIEAEMPGIDPQAIEVTLDGNVLTLVGERSDGSEDDTGTLRHGERSYGRFERRFTLPETADADRIEARAEQGILKLSIGKKAGSQARRIEVRS